MTAVVSPVEATAGAGAIAAGTEVMCGAVVPDLLVIVLALP